MLLDWLFNTDHSRSLPVDRRAEPAVGRAAAIDRRASRLSRRLSFEPLEERIALTIVAGGDGSQNNSAPTDDPGYENIGIRGSGTAVYLGNGWMLTATHVGAGATYIDNAWYNMVPNSAIQLANPTGAGYTALTDLTLYQIDGRPDLPSISIGTIAPSIGWSVTMIGNGRDRQANEVYWNSSWQQTSSPSTYAGYLWNTGSQDIRWGTNIISAVGMMEGVDVNSETAFATQFTANVANEGTGSWGDSGGGVFHKDASGNWQLVGLMFSISTLPGEPIGASAFGDITYMADLSVYRNVILSAMGANHAPSGTSHTVTLSQGAPYTFGVADFGFSDAGDNPANSFQAVKITTLPAIGNLTDNGVAVTAGQYVSVTDITAGKLQYSVTTIPGGAASTSFTFQVQDNGGTAGGRVDTDPSPKTMTIDLSHVDLTPPTVAAVTPLGASTGVSVNSPVTVTFSEAVTAGSVTSSTLQLRDSNNNLVAATVTYNASTKTATLTPTAPLANGTFYMLTVVGGAGGVTDLAGNALATNIFSSFTTVAAAPPDTTPPTVTAVTPLGASTGVSTSAVVTVTFSEPLNPASVTSSTLQLRDPNNNLVAATVSYNAANNTATLTPTSPLAGSTLYMLTIVGGSSGVKDLAGNALATNTFSSFTTLVMPPPDTTPPTVIAVSPVGASTGVSVNSVVTVTFSEALIAARVTGSTLQLRDSNNNLVAASVTYNATTNTATLTPTSPLANGTTYMLTVVGGDAGLKDLAGNALGTNVFSSFTTVAIAQADTTPPTVVSVTPRGASTGVPVNSVVTVQFSEDLIAARVTSGTVQLRDANNNLVAASVTYNPLTDTATLTPTSSLANGMTYMLTVVGGDVGLKDLAGNALATNVFSSFTTVASTQVDTTPPTVVSVTPLGASTGVAINSMVTVTFSEPLNTASVTSSTLQLRDSNNNLVATAISYDSSAKSATLVPTSPLANGMTYMLTIVGGSGGIKDLAGNALATNIFSSFTTVALPPTDTTPPTVISVTPAGASTGVATSANVTATFSEALTAASVSGSTFQLRDVNSNLIAATVSYNASTKTATLTPTSPLANSMTYMLAIVGGASGVKDLAGNALATTVFSSFTTVVLPPADTTPPTVTVVTPLGASTGVAVNALATVTFSEPVNAGSISSSTIQLRDSNNNLVAATVSYNASTKTAVLDPTGSLANGMTYMITVVGGASGVKDVAGNALAANVFSSFTTVAASLPPATSSLWPSTTTPATIDSGDGQSVELGVKFTASTSGYITGIEFYKSAANGGTHTGSLWSSSGQQLATATFTSETGSGWQQVLFSTPVAVSAGVTYVASYHTNVGHYSVSSNYFSSGYSNGPLSVAANGGVYSYGAGGFPSSSYQGSNYWVDPLFSSIAPADTTAPTVVSVSPAGAATGVSTTASVSVTFSEALSVASVTSSTVLLRDSSNNLIGATVSYNASTKTATLTPTSALANGMTYMVTVVGGASGVKDLAGNAVAANVFSSFTTVAASAPSTTSSLWSSSDTPAAVDGGDGQSVEVGVKFTTSTDGYITGIRFYKSAGNGGTHTGSLWSSTGQLLATATFTSETGSGWQQVLFSTPVAVSAGVTYVASYHATLGHYSISRGYFSSGYSNGSLSVAANGGVYSYGSGGFPTNSYLGSNYWVDVVFSGSAPTDTTPPTVVGVTPAGASTNVATSASITATFSEPLNVASVTSNTFQLRDSNSNLIAATVSYNAANKTVSLTPTSALANGMTYMLTIVGGASGAKDLAGNSLASNVFSSFTTITANASPANLFTSTITPATADSGDTQAVSVGVTFSATQNGYITGIRFYKSTANTGTHIANLWTSTGQLLGTATFTSETGSGWQDVQFATPIAIAAGTSYVASYTTTAGHYSVSRSYFTAALTSGLLQTPANAGVYVYGAGFPTNSYQGSNYWVDVDFLAS
ncbi:MAG TPA: Ig-like domain-containing protein [Pirellulales bacterium]|jgi:hypothetical protein